MAFLVKVYESGDYVFVPAVDRELDVGMLHKGQQDIFMQYVQTRHRLPAKLEERLNRTRYYTSCPGSLQWAFCCICCCEDKSWDMDRDPDELVQHIRGQLTGILDPRQYELLENIGVNTPWAEGRPVLKLWLKDPARYEA